MKTLVIAEPGCTAQGDYASMVELLETAHRCGADVWKPQWVSSAERHLQRRTQRLTPDEAAAFRVKYADAYSWLQWPHAWHADFRDRCHVNDMHYACSVCLPEDVAAVAPAVDYLKISSFEAEDVELIRRCIEWKPAGKIIVSAGMDAYWPMANWAPIRLHCVSSYPTPLDQVNLQRAQAAYGHDRGQRWRNKGVSDHSRDVRTGMLAVALKAKVIEAHYRLDDCDSQNPDYVVSFSPVEFTEYIKNIRDAELMLGDGVKRIQETEKPMLAYKVVNA